MGICVGFGSGQMWGGWGEVRAESSSFEGMEGGMEGGIVIT